MRSRKFITGACAGCCLLVVGLTYAVPCPWDCEPVSNGNVGLTDFLFVIGEWGQGPSSPADVNHDQIVDINDFLELLAHWGPCPEGSAVLDQENQVADTN